MSEVALFESRRKLFVDIATTLGTRVLLLPLALVSSIVLARALQPEGKGVYTSAYTVAELATVLCALGVSKAGTYYIAGGREDQGAIRHAAFWLGVANGLAICAVIAAFAFLLAPIWLPGIPRSALLAAAPLGFLALTRGVWESFLRGEQRVRSINLVAIASSLCFVSLLVIATFLGDLSPVAALGLRALAAAVAVALAFWLVSPARSGVGLGRLDRGAVRLLFGYGLPFGVIAIVQTLSYRVDYLILQGYRGSSEVGWYSIAVSNAELLWLLPAAVGFVVFPRVAASERDLAQESAALMRWTLAATTLCAAVLAVAATPLVELLYGDAFVPSVQPLRLLLVGVVAGTWYSVLGGYLVGRGRLRGLLAATLFGLVLNVGLNFALVPAHGMDGAAVASTISYTLTGLATAALFARERPDLARRIFMPGPREVRQRLADLHRISGRKFAK